MQPTMIRRGFLVRAGALPAPPLAPARLGLSIRKSAGRTEVIAGIRS